MKKQSGIGLIILNKVIDPILSDKKKEGFKKEVEKVADSITNRLKELGMSPQTVKRILDELKKKK